MNNKFLFLILASIFFISPVFSADNDNEGTDDFMGGANNIRGDQFITVNLGAIFPLFYVLPSKEADERFTMDPLKVGISGGVEWGYFLADNFSLGAELNGVYEMTANRYLVMFPLTMNASYFFKVHPFEFPIYLGLGASFNILEDYFRITPIVKPGAGAYWILNEDWSIGLDANYWFLPEIVFGDFKEQTVLANFCRVSISGIYHF